MQKTCQTVNYLIVNIFSLFTFELHVRFRTYYTHSYCKFIILLQNNVILYTPVKASSVYIIKAKMCTILIAFTYKKQYICELF